MGLLSFLKRRAKDAAPSHQAAPASEAIDSVQQARTRARQRLIGAVVLVAAGVIGFPLLFETQPRPLSVNTPIEIARRDADATAGVSSPPPAPRAAAQGPAPASATAEGRDPIITETAAESGRELAPPAAHASSPGEAPRPAAAKPAASRPAPAAAEKKPEPASPPSVDRQRAEALLSGQDAPPKKPATPPSAADGARFVVQVGAFSDTSAAREARQKVEKLGLKTFTQVVDTSAGKRTRVRVGPFPSRAEADKAAGKLKASGLTSAVLTL
jgi:DedD protein